MDLVRVGDRGQVVIVAAAVVAIALVPMTLAYLQLGAHPDVQAGSDYGDPAVDAERMLERAVHEAACDAPRRRWDARHATIAAVDNDLQDAVTEIEGAAVEAGIAYQVDRNQSAASDWAATACPGGEMREFGDCEASDGIVVQERADETHVVAVALDVTVTSKRGTTEFTLVVRPFEE